jgi:hypothetical protein
VRILVTHFESRTEPGGIQKQNFENNIGFEVLIVMSTKSMSSWVLTPCSSVEFYGYLACKVKFEIEGGGGLVEMRNNKYESITHVEPIYCGEGQESECRFDKCGTTNGI